MANLLKTLPEIAANDEFMIMQVKSAMEDRLDFLEDREPEYDGEVHDLWDDKYSEISDIVDELEDYECSESAQEREALWNSIRSNIRSFQSMYGGLSRIKL